MSKSNGSDRRTFFRQAAAAAWRVADLRRAERAAAPVDYPRAFSGDHLKMIAFPLGGVGAGSISLGGRGQLRDWEIFNRPNKGFAPNYAFPAIWAQPAARSRSRGCSKRASCRPTKGRADSAPTTLPASPASKARNSRANSARPHRFRGSRAARQSFARSVLALHPSRSRRIRPARSPSCATASPIPARTPATVSIAFSIDNPDEGAKRGDRGAARFRGLRTMQRSAICRTDDPMRGEFVLCALNTARAPSTDVWRGWPQGRWWNSPMLFWDDFSDDGELGPEPDPHNAVGVVSLQRTIAPALLGRFHVPARLAISRTAPPTGAAGPPPRGKGKPSSATTTASAFPPRWRPPNTRPTNLPTLESADPALRRGLSRKHPARRS